MVELMCLCAYVGRVGVGSWEGGSGTFGGRTVVGDLVMLSASTFD